MAGFHSTAQTFGYMPKGVAKWSKFWTSLDILLFFLCESFIVEQQALSKADIRSVTWELRVQCLNLVLFKNIKSINWGHTCPSGHLFLCSYQES